MGLTYGSWNPSLGPVHPIATAAAITGVSGLPLPLPASAACPHPWHGLQSQGTPQLSGFRGTQETCAGRCTNMVEARGGSVIGRHMALHPGCRGSYVEASTMQCGKRLRGGTCHGIQGASIGQKKSAGSVAPWPLRN